MVSLGREDTHEQQEVKIQDIIQGSETIVTKQPVIDCQVNNSGHCSQNKTSEEVAVSPYLLSRAVKTPSSSPQHSKIHTPKTAAASNCSFLPDIWFLEMPKSKCPQKQHLAMEDGEMVDKHPNSLLLQLENSEYFSFSPQVSQRDYALVTPPG